MRFAYRTLRALMIAEKGADMILEDTAALA